MTGADPSEYKDYSLSKLKKAHKSAMKAAQKLGKIKHRTGTKRTGDDFGTREIDSVDYQV
jgi:hypothetical protein